MKIAITFGVKYDGVNEVHPVDPRITGDVYMVFEGATWREARAKAEDYLGDAFAFDYPYEDDEGNLERDFAAQIARWGYTELLPAGGSLHLSLAEARRDLERAVDELGSDHVYSKPSLGTAPDDVEDFACAYYEPDGSPSCIVGHVLSYHGVRFGWDDDANLASVRDLAGDEQFVAPQTVVEYLTAAQITQDQGGTWGQALAEAEKAIEEMRGV